MMRCLKLLKAAAITGLLLLAVLVNLVGLSRTTPVAAAEISASSNAVERTLEPAAPPPIPARRPLLQQPVLTITKTANPDPAVAGGSLTYTVEVVGDPISDVSGLLISDVLDGNVSFDSASDGGTESGGVVSWGAFDLSAGQTATRTVTVNVSQVVSGTNLNNTVSVASTEGADDSTTLQTTVHAQADLKISKSNGKSSIVPGEVTTYAIVVTNTGPSAVTGATISDSFPSLNGVTWTCSGSGGASCLSGGSGTLSETVSLPPAGELTYEAAGTVDSSARGTLVNTATVTVPVGVTDPVADNSASDSDILIAEADIRVTKTASPSPEVIAGNPLTYDIIVYNDGPFDTTGVILVDDLPSDVTFLSSTPGSPICSLIGGDVFCDIGAITSGNNISVTIQTTVSPGSLGAPLQNKVTIDNLIETDPKESNDTSTVITLITKSADLAITKSDSSDPVLLGNPLTYTLTITNNGPSNATGVVVTDTLPAVDLVSVQTTKGTCSGTDTVVCDLGDMAVDDTAAITIVVNPLSTGSLSNLANVTGDQADPTSENDSDTESTQVDAEADLVVSMTDSPDPVLPGNNLTYDITVVNNGPSPANDVSLTDNLPGGVTFVSVTAESAGVSCNGTSTVSCSLDTLEKNDSFTVQLVVSVDESTSGSLSNTASVSSSTPDPAPGNESATANTSVGEFKLVFLPILFKPLPTELYVKNDNTGANVTFVVRELSTNQEVTRCIVANNQTIPCDHNGDDSHIFPPGIYKVEVFAKCGTDATTKVYDSGKQTTRIFCK